MLLDEHSRQTNDPRDHHDQRLPPCFYAVLFQPCGSDSNGISHVHGRANTGIGINAVQKCHTPGKRIIPHKLHRAKILPAGKHHIDYNGQHLQNDQIGLQLPETFYLMRQKIYQCKHDQKIPKYIRDQKHLTKRYPVVQKAMDRITALRRDQPFREHEAHKIDHSAPKQFQMRIWLLLTL